MTNAAAPSGTVIAIAATPAAGEALSAVAPADARWLAPDRAFAAPWAGPAAPVAPQLIRETLAIPSDAAIDIALVSGSPSRKRLLIADMESTIIEQEMLDELADLVGLRDRVAEITERAMRGELDFEAAITERVALLAGLDAGVLDELAAHRITYMPGARILVATMKAQGAYCALVSGGFTHFTAKVAAELGFDEHRANTLDIADGKLTGRVVPPILGREAKLAALRDLTVRLGLVAADTIAVGDGANDVAMLTAAGLGVAFRAKPKVRTDVAASATGAVVTHSDLTALLHLQGIARCEFAP